MHNIQKDKEAQRANKRVHNKKQIEKEKMHSNLTRRQENRNSRKMRKMIRIKKAT
jgi:hypothetical protein